MDTREKILNLKEKIKEITKQEMSIMEVCGTHTMSLARNAIRSLLPENMNIISGPGCPVCVTSATDIEKALILAREENVLIATFGDMLKVPSKGDSLQNYKNVKIIYNPLESLKLAKENPDKKIVLLGIGFETTTPLIATTVLKAHEENLENFYVLPMHKLVPPALDAIFADQENKIDGLILPGHVSAVTGRKYFDGIDKYKVPGVIVGFEALDVMECLYLLSKMVQAKDYRAVNNYKRLVSEEGNAIAQKNVKEVYEPADAEWREIGVIPNSGLALTSKYQKYDAHNAFDLNIEQVNDAPGCQCGQILMGKKKPYDCKHFAKSCTPANPIGPCMVSSEGTCAAFFKYSR